MVLGILLTTSVVLASGIVAGQRTALSSDYVADTLEETNATAQIEQRAESRVLEQAGSLEGAGYIPNSDALLRRTIEELITKQYVDRVVSTNLDRLYAYLKGQRPTLKLAIDTTPIIEDVRPTVRDQLRSIPVADLLQQEAFANALSLPGVEVSTQKFARAYDDPQTFNEIQREYSRLVDQPGVTQQDLVDEVISQTRPKVDGLPQYVQEAIFELERTFVIGFTSEDMSHEQFRQNVQQARNNFYDAVARYAQQQVTQQVEDPISITDQLSTSNRQTLDQASGIVQLTGTLGVVLPLLALVLIAVIAFLTHSVSRTARVVGSGLLAAGVLGFVVGVVASGQVRSRIREELGSSAPQFVRETVQALVDGVFSALNTQNILIALIGAVLLGVYFYVDRKQPEAVPADWR